MKDTSASGVKTVSTEVLVADVIVSDDETNGLSNDNLLDNNEPAQSEEQKLSDYFSENKEVMDLFLAFCFLIQRVNTGGVSIAELQVLNNISKKMVDNFGLDAQFLNYIVSSISDNKEIYKVFIKNSSELNIVQKQHPKRLCEIMTEHMPKDCGYVLKLKLEGVLIDDLKRVESLLALINKTHIRELTSIENNFFSIEATNPWSLLLEDYRPGHNIEKNTMVTAFKHPVSESSSIYLIKSLVTVRRWLLRRIPKEIESSNKKVVVERLSKFDATIEREKFLGITPTFLSISANRPYRNEKLNSRFVSIHDVEPDIEEDMLDDTESGGDQKEPEVAASVGMLAKAKTLFSKFGKKKDKQDAVVTPINRDYEITLVDYAGFEVSYKNLSWYMIDEPQEDTLLRQYRQIFFGCAIGDVVDNTIDVSREIVGRWMDAAIGYYMAANYTIKENVEDDEYEY